MNSIDVNDDFIDYYFIVCMMIFLRYVYIQSRNSLVVSMLTKTEKSRFQIRVCTNEFF